MSRIRANQITNQSADGAPTVQNGLVVSGVTTSTTFSGSGASLTNLPAQVTLSNNADNRVITGGSGVNLNGEANLTFDGTTFKVQAATPALEISGTNSNGGNSSLHFNANANHWVLEADNYTQQNLFSIKSGTTASSTHRLIINSNGGVGINTSNFSGQLNNEVGLAVHGSSNDNCRISITTPTKSNSRLGYYGLSNRFGIDVHNGFEIRDAEASYATRLLIASNGDFGFNDTSPTAHSSGNNTVLSIKGKGSSYSGKIDFKDSDGNLDSYINSDNSILQFYADPNSQNGNTLMRFYVHGAERFRFGAAGQFGIGTNYGTAGQVLKSGGASAAPTWGSASGGHTETYARVVFGAVYDTNSGYIVHNITTGSSNGITIDTTNERVTPTVAGTYLVIYNAHWMGLHSSGATYYNRITKNGSEYISSNFSAYDPGSHMHTVMTTIDMNGSSDYIQFEFYENKSGAAAYVNHKSRAVVILLDT